MTELSFITQHFSVPAKNLIEPAPSPDQLELILQAAMSAPDHGHIQPFRFLIIEGDARMELASVFETATRNRNPNVDEATVTKQKEKPLRSPMIIVVIACIQDIAKIPDIEQILCAGAAAQHIQLACSSMGFGSIWLTGDNNYDILVHQALGLDIKERIIGFLYVGTPDGSLAPKTRHSASEITQYWKKPQVTDFAI